MSFFIIISIIIIQLFMAEKRNNDATSFDKDFLKLMSNCSRTIHPWTIVPWTTTQWTIATQGNGPTDNCYLGQLPLGQMPQKQFPARRTAPQTILLDNSHLRLLYCSQDDCTRIITAQSNGNCKLQLFHGYFLFLFYDPII